MDWQNSIEQCPFCHSWLVYIDRSVSAMIIVIVLGALAIWGIVATVVELRRDGYRPVPTDWSRVAGAPGHARARH
jgi:hypothetical protein